MGQQKLRELKVEESEYYSYRKRAGKEINSLLREYGRQQQAVRIRSSSEKPRSRRSSPIPPLGGNSTYSTYSITCTFIDSRKMINR